MFILDIQNSRNHTKYCLIPVERVVVVVVDDRLMFIVHQDFSCYTFPLAPVGLFQ